MIGWLVNWYRYCFISRLQRSFSLFGVCPVVFFGVVFVPPVVCGFNQLSSSFQTRCAVVVPGPRPVVVFMFPNSELSQKRQIICLSLLGKAPWVFLPWPPLLDVSKKKTSKYSAAGGLLVSQQKSCKPLAYCRKYLFWERKSCLLVLHYGGCQLCYGGNDTLSRAGGIFL